MEYEILFGTPEMKDRLENLFDQLENDAIGKNDLKLLKKFEKTTRFLASDPFYNSLRTHEISSLTKRYGRKVMQSYMENKTPKPWRLYWVFGPDEQQITLIGMERHPNDAKASAYDKVQLSGLPEG